MYIAHQVGWERDHRQASSICTQRTELIHKMQLRPPHILAPGTGRIQATGVVLRRIGKDGEGPTIRGASNGEMA
jgi:hypothetical protein